LAGKNVPPGPNRRRQLRPSLIFRLRPTFRRPQRRAARTTAITLQVASFRSRGNAGRALAELQRAAVDGAHLQQVHVGGKAFWRLRVGPIDAARVPDVAARIARLGFDQPQPVRITSLDDGARDRPR
jgi:hypothetical protein